MKTVAIIGGGGTGCTMAADNALRGNRVRLYEEAELGKNLADIREAGGIEMIGQAINGFAKIDLITSDMREAVEGADVVLIAAFAGRHGEIAASLAPLLKAGQTVCFSAGNCGSILLRDCIGENDTIVVGEMMGNIYPCRFIGRAKVKSAFPYKVKKVAAFPAKDTQRLIEGLNGVYECAPAKNVLEATLNSPNVVVHLAGSLLNTCAIDRNPDFKLYSDGLSEHVIRCIEKVEEEKVAVMKAAGLEPVLHAPFMRQLVQYGSFPEFNDFREVSGPSSLDHRYVNEDAGTGQTILYSLANVVGIEIPCACALITIASTVNRVDYFKTGKTLSTLGMDGMNVQQLSQYLYDGKKSNA